MKPLRQYIWIVPFVFQHFIKWNLAFVLNFDLWPVLEVKGFKTAYKVQLISYLISVISQSPCGRRFVRFKKKTTASTISAMNKTAARDAATMTTVELLLSPLRPPTSGVVATVVESIKWEKKIEHATGEVLETILHENAWFSFCTTKKPSKAVQQLYITGAKSKTDWH